MPRMPMRKGGMTTINRYFKRDESVKMKKKKKDEFDEWYETLSEEEKKQLEGVEEDAEEAGQVS